MNKIKTLTEFEEYIEWICPVCECIRESGQTFLVRCEVCKAWCCGWNAVAEILKE